MRLVVTVVGANLEGKQRVFQRQVGTEHQDGLLLVQVVHRAELAGLAAQRIQQAGDIAGAVVVDVVGLEDFARELLQVEVLFVAGVVGADDAEAPAIRERSG